MWRIRILDELNTRKTGTRFIFILSSGMIRFLFSLRLSSSFLPVILISGPQRIIVRVFFPLHPKNLAAYMMNYTNSSNECLYIFC